MGWRRYPNSKACKIDDLTRRSPIKKICVGGLPANRLSGGSVIQALLRSSSEREGVRMARVTDAHRVWFGWGVKSKRVLG